MKWKHKILHLCLIVFVLSSCGLAEASDILKYYVLETVRDTSEPTTDKDPFSKSIIDRVRIFDITIEVTTADTGSLDVRLTIEHVTEWSNGQYYVALKEPSDTVEYQFKVDAEGIVSEVKEGATKEQEKSRYRFREEAQQVCNLLFETRNGEKDEKRYLMRDYCTREYGSGWERYWSMNFKKVLRAEQTEKIERDIGGAKGLGDSPPIPPTQHWTHEKKVVVAVNEDDWRRYAHDHLKKEEEKENSSE